MILGLILDNFFYIHNMILSPLNKKYSVANTVALLRTSVVNAYMRFVSTASAFARVQKYQCSDTLYYT